MFNNDQLFDIPWKHVICDNFFSDSDKIFIAAEKLQKKYFDTIISSDKCLSLFEVYDVIGDEAFKIILDKNKFLLDNIKEIVKFFPNARKCSNYISIPSFHILPPNTDWQKIHDEAYDKTASVVVYLYPTYSIGTALYERNDRNSFCKEIVWKQNTAMLFCGEKNVTWHDFRSGDHPRVTLNFFLRTLKDYTIDEDDEKYKVIFGNDLPTYIPKRLPKNILNTWFNGEYLKEIKW